MAWFTAPIIIKGLAWGAGVAASVLASKKTKDWVSDTLEQKTRDKIQRQLTEHANAYLSQLEQAWHRAFWRYFAIQNGVLFVALGLSFWLGSGLFFIGLALVFIWNGVLAFGYRSVLIEFWQHKSLQRLLAARLNDQLTRHWQTLSHIEQRWLDWFITEKQHDICQQTAEHLLPRVRFALINLVLMLVLSFVVFRLAVVPFV